MLILILIICELCDTNHIYCIGISFGFDSYPYPHDLLEKFYAFSFSQCDDRFFDS